MSIPRADETTSLRRQLEVLHGSHAAMHGQGLERWDDLKVFLSVLREGSFGLAAQALGVEQSTVSRRIAALEAALGAPLFDRLASGPRATDLARRLRTRAEAIEAQVLALADTARNEARVIDGRVRLALTASFAVQVVIPHLASELARRHPKLALDLIIDDHAADLARREADLALRFFRPRGGDLVTKRVARLPLTVLAHRSYLRKRKGADALDWIVLDLPGAQLADGALLAQLGVEPRMRVTNHLAQIEAVRAGLGVALLTRSLQWLDSALVEVDLALPPFPSVELWLVVPRALRHVPRVAAVWSLLEERMPELEAEARGKGTRRAR